MIYNFDILLSDICNLNCSFCYTKRMGCEVFNKEFTDKCFKWIFDYFISNAKIEHYKKGIRICIYGGEPLVEWIHLKQVVIEQKQNASTKGIPISFTIVTNVSLLSEEKLDWLIQNNVGVSMSIDGCPAAQDMERKYKDGTGSSTIVYENAKRVLEKTKNSSVRMTISPKNVPYLYESVLFLRGIGFRNITPIHAAGVEWSDDNIEIFKEQFQLVNDWWVSEMREGRHCRLYYLNRVFNNISNPMKKKHLCGACRSLLGIDMKGRIFPCHRFCNPTTPEKYVLGNIYDGILGNEMLNDINTCDMSQKLSKRCENCPASLACKSYCIHEMAMNGDMFTPTELHCIIWKHYWNLGITAYNTMIAEKNELFKKLYLSKST